MKHSQEKIAREMAQDENFHESRRRYNEAAYWLGVRDARLGHAETWPARPYSSDELDSYRQGYGDQRATMATS